MYLNGKLGFWRLGDGEYAGIRMPVVYVSDQAAAPVPVGAPSNATVPSDQVARTQPVTKVIEPLPGTGTVPTVIVPKDGGAIVYAPPVGDISGAPMDWSTPAPATDSKPVPWGLIALAALTLAG